MWRRLSLFCAAVLTAMAGLQGAGAAQSAALAPTREACRNLGNGNLCIRVAPTSSLAAKITVWYDKNAGAKRYIRLRYYSPGQVGWDDGAFWISTGQVKGYIWYDQPLTQGCFIGQLQDLTDGGLGVTSGGYVCY
ncbi:hypothetical protein OIE67_03140 [Nonomuraea fuscirosea]|jgi:hypothetical protein|uniref:hypothetical protein n=1 Tax=Nonomuraea fuscirosea TaxID=1291556 RepID=UPI002DDAFCC3|nr:hypothetical protein [Nonomuraea fuscirosea]WSA53649.1 hypothetical protein OIE67_03140 [Nonomuraea fuscirosea]